MSWGAVSIGIYRLSGAICHPRGIDLRFARHSSTIWGEPPLASAPAVSSFGGIVLSQCAAARV